MTLVIGDDSPMQGKVPPGYANYNLLVDPYATWGDPAGPVMAALNQGASGGTPAVARTASFWGGSGGSSSSGSSGGSSGGGNTSVPGIDDSSSTRPDTGYPSKPVDPTKPTDPIIEVPGDPDLPPLAPVPVPDAAPMLIASLLAFALLRRVRG